MIPERTWRIAAALAAACSLDWGRWARGLTATPPWWSVRVCRRHDEQDCVTCFWENADDRPVHVPAPASWSAAAAEYRADCERRGVEPGPMPGAESHGDWSWRVKSTEFGIHVELWTATFAADVYDDDCVQVDSRALSFADLRRLAELVTVVERASAAKLLNLEDA